jgi:GT2 family glycosyltransferase
VRFLSSIDGLPVTQPSAILSAESTPARIQPSQSDVSVVIVTRDRPEDLAACIRSLEPAEGDIREVIVVDDASKASPIVNESILPTRILRNETRLFLSESRNKGAKDANGKFIMFIDDDNIVDRECIRRLSASLENDSLNMVASPAICYTSQPGRVWFAGGWMAPVSGIFVAPYRGIDSSRLPRLPYYTEVFHDAFMVRRQAFERLGYFDEVNFPMYLSEADFAARLKESHLGAIVVPDALVWHSIAPMRGAASLLRGVHITEPARAYFVGRNRLLYMKLHGGPIAFILHVVAFEPVIISIHIFAMLSGHGRIPWTRLFGPYLRGVLDGLSGRITAGKSLIDHRQR